MVRTSRAVVFEGDGTWQLREFDVPDPPRDGALLRVEAVGMCHSDIDHLHGIVHTQWGGEYPSIPGHEIVGRIDSLTPTAASAWRVTEGDRVAVRAAVITADDRRRTYGHDFSVNEGSGLFGGYADYMELLPGTQVFRLPDSPPAEELSIWEPLAVALRWTDPVGSGDTVAVLGPGHLGLSTVVAARAAGAERIFVTGTAADGARLTAARRLGADETVDVDVEDAVERVAELTHGRGVDVVVDAASGTTATVMQGMQMVRRGGNVVIGGLKDRKPVEGFIIDWIPMGRIHLQAGADGDMTQAAVELLWEGTVPTADLVGEVFRLEDVGEALAVLDRKVVERDAIRVGLRLAD